MFSLKISKNTTEKLFAPTLFSASFAAGCLLAFDNAKLSPLFSQTPDVLTGAVCAFFIIAAAACFYRHCLQNAPRLHQAVLNGFLLFVSLFFLPLDVALPPGNLPPFAAVVSAVLTSSGVPLLILSNAFFLRAPQSPKEKFVLFLTGMLAAACVCLLVPDFLSFKVRSVAVSALYVLCAAAFTVCSDPDAQKNDTEAAESKDAARTDEKFVWQAAGVAFFNAFVCVGLWLAARRYTSEFLYEQSVVPALFLPLGLAALILANVRISDACAKIFWFLQPFAAALFFVLYLLTFVGVNPALHLPVYAVLAGGAACMAAQTVRETKYFQASVFAGALTAVALVGFVFPRVFYWNAEYPFFVVLALAMRSGVFFKGRSVYQVWQDFAYPLALLFLFFCAFFKFSGSNSAYMMMNAGVFIIVGALPMLRTHPLRYAMTCAVALIFGSFVFAQDEPLSAFRPKIFAARDFYGLTAATADKQDGQVALRLYLNRHLKGVEFFTADGAHKPPAAPYDVNGGVGKFFFAARQTYANPSVAVIGASTGVLSSYAANAYEDWRYFEPDPAVVKIMSGGDALFSYFGEQTPYASVIAGEPVLNLMRSPAAYDILIADMFAFRHFPSYLLTPDAFMVYLSKLNKGGALVFNFMSAPSEWKPALTFVLKQLNVYALSYRPIEMPENCWVVITGNADLVAALRKTSPLWERVLP